MLGLTRKLVAPAVVLATVATFASSASAVPLANALVLKNAVPNQVESVQWRRRGWGWGGAGFVAGAIIGSALASPYYYGNGYRYGYNGYNPTYYSYAAPTYYAAPAYAPAYYGGYGGGGYYDGGGYYGGWGYRRGYGRW
jgi:hypothetical protein